MIRLAVVVLCLMPAAVAAEPAVKRDVVHYDVIGSTPLEIRAVLARIGPLNIDGKQRFDAVTRWRVRWNYRYRDTAQGCTIASVSVNVDVTITMPRLKADASTSPTLARAFAVYTEKLLLHENGHADIGIEAAKQIETGIRQLGPLPSCDALGQAANALGNALIREANRKDLEYDARTQHGRTQGARFP